MTVETFPTYLRQRENIVARVLAFVGDLEDHRRRLRIYLALAAIMYVAALGMMASKALFSKTEARFDFAPSDGKFYYQYLPSAVIDHDLDFRNQLRDGWGYEEPYSINLEHDRVKYPIGVSLSLLPSFLIAHGLSVPLYAMTGMKMFTPNGYTVLYQLLNLGAMMVLSLATMVMVDGLLTRTFRISGVNTLLAILAAFAGTAYIYHTVRFPGMAHVADTFWVTATTCCAVATVRRMREEKMLGAPWLIMVFCFAMAVVTRPTSVVFAALFVPIAVIAVQEKLIGKLVASLPFTLIACWPVVMQLVFWKTVFGVWFPHTYSHGEFHEPFYWSHPQLLNNLISFKAGVLLYNPVWLLAIIGAIVNYQSFGRMTWLFAATAVSVCGLWYINSAWWCWPLSAYPGRGFLEFSWLSAVGIGLLLQHATAAKRSIIYLLCAAALFTGVLFAAYDLKLIPRYVDVLIEQAQTELRKT